MLRIDSISAGYTDENIIKEVSLYVDEGEIVTIIGPNGCGKSTLMKSIFGLTKIRGGGILFKGQDVTGLRPDEMVQRGMSYVPQERNIFPALTVRENLEMGAIALSGGVDERISTVLELFPGLAGRMNQRAGTLSGGEQKMLAVGRAMIIGPSMLLLDEPSAALSPKIMMQLFAEIKKINERGVTILMVEQNARRALSISDRGYVMEMGRTRLDGPAKSLLDNPDVCRLYLGTRN